MEMKTYFASNVPAALDLARKELGSDAMLLNSRPAPPDMRSFGRLEVTFAYDPQLQPPEPPARILQPPGFQTLLQAAMQKQETPLDELRGEIAALRNAFRSVPGVQQEEPWKASADRLTRSGLQPDTAREIAEAALRRDEPEETAVRHELSERVRVRHFVPLKAGESRTVALIGPPGRGKSSTLVKIAFRFGLEPRTPVRIYSAGVHPVGAAEQMARYAALLGVPFNWYETVESLHLALAGDRWRGLALIDTPGLSPNDSEELSTWERFFRLYPDMERHFVLRADARSADLCRVIARFECLRPTHLLFTGLDEVADYSVLVEGAIRSELPLGFGGNGPRIPDDLVEIEGAQLVRTVWDAGAKQAMAAAA